MDDLSYPLSSRGIFGVVRPLWPQLVGWRTEPCSVGEISQGRWPYDYFGWADPCLGGRRSCASSLEEDICVFAGCAMVTPQVLFWPCCDADLGTCEVHSKRFLFPWNNAVRSQLIWTFERWNQYQTHSCIIDFTALNVLVNQTQSDSKFRRIYGNNRKCYTYTAIIIDGTLIIITISFIIIIL
jgi:hypothetical protein